MGDILDINAPVHFNNDISSYELHAHQTFGSSSFENSDEIRISIQNQDLFILPYYQKIIVNAKHEIILVRSRSDLNSIVRDVATFQEEVKFDLKITKVEWLVPYVTLSNRNKMEMMKYIQKDPVISIGFRTWELYEYPLLPTTNHHIWTVKTSTQLEKPRYVILAFQTNRKNVWHADAARFDHCNITNVKLYLNSQIFPYGNLNLDISKNQFSLLYDMYANFSESYYGAKIDLISKNSFIHQSPLIVIDCSKQNEL
ncbi:uncharacterized protein LOC122859885 [Aphidius gifuensis]|uniref:uncharacterized protein LOC122859885 n=1 Tax=Aphidius gifuensis TaxID=684658 RepID=UPI001CDD676F|nr:uncharacterized protein LOC122859885 [Aphidius gifuensis]